MNRLTVKQMEALELGRTKGLKKNRPSGLKYEIKVKNIGWFKKGHNPWFKDLEEYPFKGNGNGRWAGGRQKNRGYIQLVKPDDLNARSRGRVFEHRWVVEKRIGRKLRPTEVVHHINGIKDDNRFENLLVFKNNSEHVKYERKKQKCDERQSWVHWGTLVQDAGTILY